jgi:hypothetical protein
MTEKQNTQEERTGIPDRLLIAAHVVGYFHGYGGEGLDPDILQTEQRRDYLNAYGAGLEDAREGEGPLAKETFKPEAED